MALAISSLGMISSVGHDVVTACASIRAGITRPALTLAEVLDEEGMEGSFVYGHPVSGITDGFQGVGVLARLGCRALEDLLSFGNLRDQLPEFWTKTGLLVCLSRAKGDEMDVLDALVEQSLPKALLGGTGLPILPGNIRLFFEGNASVAYACDWATKNISDGSLKRCIVLGIDSLVDRSTISQLSEDLRLRTPDSPTGMIPGEAAAAVLLEETAVANSRGAPGQLQLGRVHVGFERNHFLTRDPVFGRATATAILSVIPQGRLVREIIADLNGETRRSMDWGHSATLVLDQLGYFPEELLLPAESIGDTGAASGTVGLCVAARAMSRGYLIGDDVIISSMSDSGEVGSLLVTRVS
jgi:3-oxoacyl-[acyl-carrier-protein] synthase-1